MGLDFVELVMTIETEFGADINAAGDRVFRTVGDMYDFLASTLGVTGEAERARLWTRLVDVIERQQGIRRDRITREARFRDDLEIH